VQCSDLTDEDLWRAIAENTNAMSALLNGGVDSANDSDSRTKPRSRLLTLDKCHREYRDFAAELLRRYPTSAASPANWDDAHKRRALAG
jgi:hypothetical protein